MSKVIISSTVGEKNQTLVPSVITIQIFCESTFSVKVGKYIHTVGDIVVWSTATICIKSWELITNLVIKLRNLNILTRLKSKVLYVAMQK